MTIRMTMTAVALGAMTLAGCSSGKDTMMTKPVVAAPGPAAAPAAAAPKLIGAPNRAADAGTLPGGTAASESVMPLQSSVEVERVSGNGSIGDPFETEVITTVTDGSADGGSEMTSPTAIEGRAQIQREADFSDAARMERKMDDGMMSSTNAAFDSCTAGGGSVVNFIGDPSGETMACEVDGAQTIIVM